MPIKAFAFELKRLDETGSFTGMASVYGNVDLGGDIVERGAFTKTLAESGKNRPLLWQHSAPIGLVELSDSSEGLHAKGRLSLGIQAGQDAHVLLTDGVVKGLSIGFATVRDEISAGVRKLLELKLYEVSLVTFPMNPAATITSSKSTEHARDEIARATKELHEFYQALRKNS